MITTDSITTSYTVSSPFPLPAQPAAERLVVVLEQRPHYSIGMKVPSQVHLETGPQQQVWKPVKEHSRGASPECFS